MGFMDRGDQECVKCVKKLETGIKIETHIIYEVHQEFTTAQCSFRAAGGKERSWKNT